MARLLANPATSPVVYTAEETEVLKAMHEYQRRNDRPFPTYREILAVIVSLGYRQVEPKEPPPKWFGDRFTKE